MMLFGESNIFKCKFSVDGKCTKKLGTCNGMKPVYKCKKKAR